MRTLITTLMLLLFTSQAHAVPLNVVEGTDFAGDSAFPGPNTFVGDLDIGVNMISGNLFEGDIRDTIRFTLQNGMKIDSVDVIISNHRDSVLGNTEVQVEYQSPYAFNFIAGNGSINIVTNPATVPGDVYLKVVHSGFIPEANSDWKANITVSSTVVVPEPITATLIPLAVAPLLLRRRREA